LRDGSGGDGQRLTACGDFHRFEIQALARPGTYERFDLLGDLGFERRLEPPFSAASFEAARESWIRAAHNFSLTSMNC